jgi:hypothetical protein
LFSPVRCASCRVLRRVPSAAPCAVCCADTASHFHRSISSSILQARVAPRSAGTINGYSLPQGEYFL